jgi:hypothetical protein
VVAARSFARRLREAVAAAAPTDANAPSTIRTLATRVAHALDETTRRLGGAPPLSPASDQIDGVAASANALVNAIGTYGPHDWTEDRGGTPAIEALRSGIAEAGALVRQATALTEPSG